ncbi:MAG: adenosine deaminase family protein [Bdellovibrionales bacterium]|nr:adenosine deaminase family protein [Bdellovibrionales bacterium]
MTENLREFVAGLPKADLHVHLEGCCSPELLRELAAENGVSLTEPIRLRTGFVAVPPADAGKRLPSFRSFQDFVNYYLKITEVIQSEKDVRRLAEYMITSCQEQGVIHVEAYFSPTTYLLFDRPLDPLFAGLRSAQEFARDRGVTLRWIFDIVRNAPGNGEDTVRLAQTARSGGVDVAAIGLAGAEDARTPNDFLPAFELARREGFHILAHSGESGDASAVEELVRVLRPERIGHGRTVIESPSVTEEFRRSGRCIEACPWSNVLLGLCDRAAHPVMRMKRAGLNVVLCSDDPGIFGHDTLSNYELASALGATRDELSEFAAASLQNAFVPEKRS